MARLTDADEVDLTPDEGVEASLKQVLRDASAQAGVQVQARPALKRPSSALQVHSQPKAAGLQRDGRKQRGGKKAGCGWKKAMLKVPQYQIRMYARGKIAPDEELQMQEPKRACREEASEHRRRVTVLLLLQLHKCPTLILCSSSAMASGAEQWLAGQTTYPVSFHVYGSDASTLLARSVRMVIVYDDFFEAAALMRHLHTLQSAATTVYHLTLSNNRCSNTRVPFVSRLRSMGVIVPKVHRETLLNLAWTDHVAAKAMITALPHSFRRAPQAVRSERTLALAAMRVSGYNLFYAAAEFANDEEMVCTAVANVYFKHGFLAHHRAAGVGQEARERILQGAEQLQMQALGSGVRLCENDAIDEYAAGHLPQRIVRLTLRCRQPLTLGCFNLAGDELASVCLETSDLETAEALREHIASTLDVPKFSLRVLLPSGSQLPRFGPLRSPFGMDEETANMANAS